MSVMSRRPAALLAVVLCLGVVGCGEQEPERVSTVQVIEPGRPGEAATTHAPGTTFGPAQDPWNAADATFLAQMIPHHAQALEMARMAPGRAQHPQVLGLASRIADVQGAEMAVYERWLADHGMGPDGGPSQGGADHGGHEGHTDGHLGHEGMAGMASAQDLAALEASSGADFDARWLRLMIAHHEGALDMAADRAEAGGQNVRVDELAADVVASQTDEIATMERLLAGG